MKNHILYGVQYVIVCPYRLIFFNDYFDQISKSEEFKNSNIYIFAKVKKLRFDLNSTKLINKRTLKTSIIIGNKKIVKTTISFFDTVPIFKKVFETKENFEDLCSDGDDFWNCKLDKKLSTSDKLHFFQTSKTGEKLDFWLIPENIKTTTEVKNDIDFNNRPEIVYVGQSFNMNKRIKSHQTLLKAISLIKEDEEIKIFFLTFNYGYGGHKNFVDFNNEIAKIWLSEPDNSIEFKSKIKLIERFLIYFFKPIYNEQHVNTDIISDSLVKTILLKNKIDCITINLDVYGKAFEFWSTNQLIKTNFCSFNFLKPELGFQEGLITNWF